MICKRFESKFFSFDDKERSLAWNLEGDWLDHTGYTGTFIMWNRQKQEAAIFLSNRTYERMNEPSGY